MSFLRTSFTGIFLSMGAKEPRFQSFSKKISLQAGSSKRNRIPNWKTEPVKKMPPKGKVMRDRSHKYFAVNSSRMWFKTPRARGSLRSLPAWVTCSGFGRCSLSVIFPSFTSKKSLNSDDVSEQSSYASGQVARNSVTQDIASPAKTIDTSSLKPVAGVSLYFFSLRNSRYSLSALL